MILRTDDGGATWTRQSIPYAWAELTNMTWFGPQRAIVVGLGMALQTDDGGATWKPFDQGFKPAATQVVRVDEKTGFILGLWANAVKTTDGGATWKQVSIPGEGHPYSGAFADGKTGYLSGQMQVRRTQDGGETWEALTGSPDDTFAILVADANTVCVFSRRYSGGCFGTHQPVVICSRDGGITWPERQILKDLDGLCERLIQDSSKQFWYGVTGNTVFKLRLR